MQRNYITIFFLSLFTSFYFKAPAQEIPHFVEKLTTENGLSSNKINDIVQDDNGFLWIATTDGLNRFDGTEVVQYFHRDNANSISHDYVHCLEKLADNYIAIATQAGLDFYNSNTGIFTNFYYRKNDPLDEYNNIITKLEMDSRGNLWAASGGCIFIFDHFRKLMKVIPSSFTEEDITRNRMRFVEKMLPLSNGDMLLYLSTGIKVYSFKEDRLIDLSNSYLFNDLNFLNDLFNASVFEKDYSPYANVFKIYDRYFLCIKPFTDSLFVFDEHGKLSTGCYFPYNKYPYILWSQKLSVIDSSGLLFLFHNYGLANIAITWQDSKPVIHAPDSLLFENYEYDAALPDRQGNRWLATTEQGVQKISPGKQNFKSITLIDKTTGKPVKYAINSISKYNNTVWISTYGNGFFEIDALTHKQKQHFIKTIPANQWANFIWNVRQINTDTLWVGTQAGMYWYCLSDNKGGHLPDYPGKPSLLDSVAITMQSFDSRGRIWMGLGKGNGACFFDTKTNRFTYYPGNSAAGYPFRYPTKVAEDKKGDLWFVNDASGSLGYLEKNSERFQKIPLENASHRRLGNLSAILCSNDTVLWVGTVTDGLVKFNISTRQVTVYGHDKGLNNNHINSIYEDKEKRLWLATEGDLSFFDQQTGTFTSYTEKKGLPVNSPGAGFYYDITGERLYSGGTATLFYFEPDKMNANEEPQKTIITAMYVNGKFLMPDHNQIEKFKYWQNDITIQYSAIDLTNGPDTRYAYSLVGEDTGWIMAGNQRQINFSRLAPGSYTFKVRASGRNGIWADNIESIRFHIGYPFTQTVWFYALILLATGVVFYTMYRFRLNQVMRTEKIRSEISKNLHDEVGSTLTNISLSSLLAQKQLHDENSLKRILKRIYDDSRHVSESMREIVWSINPKIDTLGESLPRMLNYASELLEAENIEVHAAIAPEIENLKLTMQRRRDLYMIFKETINNLAKHSKASQVVIKVFLKDKSIVMTVSDNGIGFDTTAPRINNGLRNMQDRAQSHHWDLAIESGNRNGTTVTLKAQIA